MPRARKAAVAATPGAARRFGPFCAEHGADLFLVQSQVSSARHLATEYDPLSLDEFTRYMPIPVAVGNTTNAEAAFALMEQGAAAVFVGVGPGAACTTREVLGIGVPQVTAISDVAAARDAFHTETGRYVPVVADGGMRRGGELAKAIAAGADVLMLGSPLARAEEAPGRGTNWGWRRLPRRSRAARASGSDDRHARTDPAGSGPCHRRVGEPRRGAAPVDGGPRRTHDPRHAAGRDGLRAVDPDRGQVLAAGPLTTSDRGAMEDELVASGRFVRIETRGARSGEPRAVTVGFVDDELTPGALLVAAGSIDADWASNLLADPACHVRTGDRAFEALAEPLAPADHARAIRGLILRYGTPAEGLGHGPSFRLRPLASAGR